MIVAGGVGGVGVTFFFQGLADGRFAEALLDSYTANHTLAVLTGLMRGEGEERGGGSSKRRGLW